MQLRTQECGQYRLAVSVDHFVIVYRTAGFETYEEAQSRVGHAVRYFAPVGQVVGVQLQRRLDCDGDPSWTTERRWGRSVVDRILTQHTGREETRLPQLITDIKPTMPMPSAARRSLVVEPLDTVLCEQFDLVAVPAAGQAAASEKPVTKTSDNIPIPSRTKHKSYRWPLIATFLIVIVSSLLGLDALAGGCLFTAEPVLISQTPGVVPSREMLEMKPSSPTDAGSLFGNDEESQADRKSL